MTMTSISTLLAPVLTPLLTLWLAGEYMPVSASAMAGSIVKVVLIPVVAGILIGMLFPRLVAKINAALPWISVAAISAIVCIVVGGAHDTIATAGALVFAAVVAHNACGYLLGYIAGAVTKQPIAARRTMAVEVGMQNSGLATSLASTYMNTHWPPCQVPSFQCGTTSLVRCLQPSAAIRIPGSRAEELLKINRDRRVGLVYIPGLFLHGEWGLALLER